MPMYDYECGKCHKQFEALIPLKDSEDPQVCGCGYMARRVMIKAPGIVEGVNHNNKLNEGWKDLMRETKKSAGKGCTIDPDGTGLQNIEEANSLVDVKANNNSAFNYLNKDD